VAAARRRWTIRYEPAAVVRHVHSATSVEWSPTFVFHTDRNRLLVLVKNASPGLALREVGRYPLTTGSIALRTVRTAARARVRPDLRPTLLRLRVGSFPAPAAGHGAQARLGRPRGAARELQRWLVARR
jgi:hypothetical protein